MTLKSSWIVLLSFTISAFIKKIHFIFFQRVNWKNLSRKTITGKRITSSHLQPCVIAKFIPQNRGNQTWPTPRGQTSNKGDATDTDLWHSWMFRCLFNFPSSRKQVAAHTKARHVDGEPFTPSSFPCIPEPHSILPILNPHVALDTLPHSRPLHHPQEQKLGKEQRFGEYNTREDWKRQQAQLQISLKRGQRQNTLGSATKHQHNLLSLQLCLRHFIWLFSGWQGLHRTPYAHWKNAREA